MPLKPVLAQLDELIVKHPDHADLSTVKHARALLQRAHDKQRRAPGNSYTQIVERHLNQKG